MQKHAAQIGGAVAVAVRAVAVVVVVAAAARAPVEVVVEATEPKEVDGKACGRWTPGLEAWIPPLRCVGACRSRATSQTQPELTRAYEQHHPARLAPAR